jgi:hypothetical protein
MKAVVSFPWSNESTNSLCHWPMQSRPYLCSTCKIYIDPNCLASVFSPNIHTIMLSASFLRVLQPQLFQRFIFNYASHSGKVREVPLSIKMSILQCLRCSQTDILSWTLCSPTWHLHNIELEKNPSTLPSSFRGVGFCSVEFCEDFSSCFTSRRDNNGWRVTRLYELNSVIWGSSSNCICPQQSTKRYRIWFRMEGVGGQTFGLGDLF